MKRLLPVVIVLVFASLACSRATLPRTPTLSALQAAYHTITAMPPPSSTPTPTPPASLAPTPTPPPPTGTPTPTPTGTPTLSPTPSLTFTAAFTLAGEAACVPFHNQTESGVVTSVIDGDTIGVKIGGAHYWVRLIGVDAPEDSTLVEHFGPQARQKSIELLYGQAVRLVRGASERDAGGRLLRYAFVGQVFVNYELARQGYAYAIPSPPDEACNATLKEAERLAQAERLGLWASAVAATGTPIRLVFPTQPTPKGLETVECVCSQAELHCGNFYYQADAQACYIHCLIIKGKDVHGLDPDGDGIACEYLP
ncbi:MAG: thermonuclease family protein [Anaerolineales bacterium]|nr:thermonuclease family protein [Anaerolineales bacterium]